ncbi:MAG: hypothetical protein A2086_01120 [Spirochaetes bacterium GWD1_27_9]|nr:MAG: hypothetical protein A2Z98_16050 [Spirochaetes bacterium GWB1_27_13]OHD27981.1 MAG: hypothetical protein A2Y34_11480 [Spirochaetes bacterium GWC1_27_15]OHD33653.1 MAG: hypothetical protein A2086_01120 [Spirochaetes bacterium GWD1_27_9]
MLSAIREHLQVIDNKIIINLPKNFPSKYVEVIVIPDENKIEQNTNKELLNLLKNGPTLNEEDFKEYNEVKQWMNSWKIEEF